MKKLCLIFAMACAALVSCNKENTETPNPQETLFENLQGKWASTEYDIYDNEEDYKNGKLLGHVDSAQDDGREALIIDGDKIYDANVVDGVVVNDGSLLEIESNDGEKIVTKPKPGYADGSVHYIIKYLGGNKIQSERRGTASGFVKVLTYIKVE